jgi:hypothetical protein
MGSIKSLPAIWVGVSGWEGYTADEARRLVSTAVTVGIFHIMRDRQRFKRERYLWNLAHLPREPWDATGKEYYGG